MKRGEHHPPAPSSEEEGESAAQRKEAPSSEEEGESIAQRVKAPSSLEEGVGGGGPARKVMLDQAAGTEEARSGGPTREVMLERAAGMRRNPPEPERRLWMELRASRFYGFKFRRQAVIGNRIVDFFCPSKGLVIEIDGATHDPEIDARRDRNMVRTTGYRILRFTNGEVMGNSGGVLLALKMALDRQSDRWPERGEHHPPAPSSEEEGESIAQRKEAPSSEKEGA